MKALTFLRCLLTRREKADPRSRPLRATPTTGGRSWTAPRETCVAHRPANQAAQNNKIVANVLRIREYRECLDSEVEAKGNVIHQGMTENISSILLRPRLARAQQLARDTQNLPIFESNTDLAALGLDSILVTSSERHESDRPMFYEIVDGVQRLSACLLPAVVNAQVVIEVPALTDAANVVGRAIRSSTSEDGDIDLDGEPKVSIPVEQLAMKYAFGHGTLISSVRVDMPEPRECFARVCSADVLHFVTTC